jgi:hypothetical protein
MIVFLIKSYHYTFNQKKIFFSLDKKSKKDDIRDIGGFYKKKAPVAAGA